MTKTRRFALALSASLVAGAPLASSSCKNLPPTAPITSTLPSLGICVVQAAVGDIVEVISDPVSLIGAIISACSAYGTATVEQIIAWLESALASQPVVTSDAGAISVAVAKARLSKVHAAALTQLHVVVNVAPASSP